MLAADLFETVLDNGGFPICESSAASGRYPKQWDLPRWQSILQRSDVDFIEFPMCAFELGPPDEAGAYYVHRTRWFFLAMPHFVKLCGVFALVLGLVIAMWRPREPEMVLR